MITPIVIKVNKNSLPLILSTLLNAPTEEESKQFYSNGSMEQILTLLRIARQNKMLLIPEDDSDIRLEPKC